MRRGWGSQPPQGAALLPVGSRLWGGTEHPAESGTEPWGGRDRGRGCEGGGWGQGAASWGRAGEGTAMGGTWGALWWIGGGHRAPGGRMRPRGTRQGAGAGCRLGSSRGPGCPGLTPLMGTPQPGGTALFFPQTPQIWGLASGAPQPVRVSLPVAVRFLGLAPRAPGPCAAVGRAGLGKSNY